MLPINQFKQGHPYHMVNESPWPILMSIFLLSLFFSLIEFLWFKQTMMLILSLIMSILCFINWNRDIIRESTFIGNHTKENESGFKLGMMWFITSEVFFFIAFFWAFFHNSLVPSIEGGGYWPPIGIMPLDAFSIPLLNTIILLSSGASLTWSHHSLISGKYFNSISSLMFTVFLGIYFTLLQLFEYKMASFNISDGTFGSVFFLATGFHGLHVIVGSIMLGSSLVRLKKMHFSSTHSIGLDLAAWYWHFVDVVWLFLFIFVYWWGSPIL